jgi:hypothetical protein
MSYRDLERGITSKQLHHIREQEQAVRLRFEMTSRWAESERILGILRSIESVPGDTKGIEDWFNGVKGYPSQSAAVDEVLLRTPNGWFASRFPNEHMAYGNAFYEEWTTSLQGSQIILPSVINEDFLAAMLSGERRLGHRMVYLPADGFWFKDPRLDAFCPTTDKKVEILLSNYLLKCAENMGANVASKVLFLDHRRPSVLAGIVQRAKTVLEADPRFFEGANAPRRVSNGRILEPSMPSSPENFIHSTFVPKEGGVVIVSEAYQKFLGYCQRENLTRVEFTEFKRVARELVMEKFLLGLRHDVRTPEGRQTHGWKHLKLLPDWCEHQGEAA